MCVLLDSTTQFLGVEQSRLHSLPNADCERTVRRISCASPEPGSATDCGWSPRGRARTPDLIFSVLMTRDGLWLDPASRPATPDLIFSVLMTRDGLWLVPRARPAHPI